MSQFLAFLMSKAGDFLLTALLCVSASCLVATGYWSGDPLVAAPLPLIAVSLFFLAVLYAASFNRATAFAGLAAVPVLTVITMVVASQTFEGAMFADVAGNPCPSLLAAIVTTVAGYLLTRRRTGVIAALFISILLIGYLQFIYKENHVVMCLTLLVSLAAMLAFRGYSQSKKGAETSGPAHSGKALAVCLAGALVLLGVGAGVYFTAVKAIDPPTAEVKLIKELLALPQVDMTGIADHESNPDKDKTSENNNDQQDNSSKEAGKDKENEGDEGSGSQNTASQSNGISVFDPAAMGQMYEQVTHSLPPVVAKFLWLLPVVLVVLIIFGVIRLKIYRRKRKLEQIAALPSAQCVEQSYLFTMKTFGKLGVPAISAKTPLEHAESIKPFIEAFDLSNGAGFEELTNSYVAAAYGKQEPTEEQVEKANTFMSFLYPNCKKHLGIAKYAVKYFWL